jgi:prepilin-type N-terminal cleavage/methylation domain-containing protein
MSRHARGERGVSLAEVLVALTVLALASAAAMVVYSGARRSYHVGSNLAEQQQNVRIAFDELTEDLRLAGFNVNPDGRNFKDEQLEFAGATAIVIRADFDAGDPVAALVPEEALAGPGSALLTVSTGNDEVRAYVLANERSSEALVFHADFASPVRDGEVEPVTIANVSLDPFDPPYTLYRIRWDEAGGEVREPLVDQVSMLRFVYYDDRGQLVSPVPGEDDAPGVNARARASIRRVGIEVEGLTRDPDLRWTGGLAIAGESGRRRQFDLAADVTPRNLGLFGVADLEAVSSPPSQPPPPSLYEGHCRGLWVEWAASPPQDEVARYEVRWGTAPGAAVEGPVYAGTNQAYIGGLADGVTYHVTVTAIDDSGSASEPSPPASQDTVNENTPDLVEGLSATEDLEGHVLLGWDAVTENAGPPPVKPAQDPLTPELRDAAGYRIYRVATNEAEQLVADHHPDTTYDDGQIVACRQYQYRVCAVDLCEKQGACSEPAAGESVYDTAPLPPPAIEAFWAGNGQPDRLEWSPVTLDVEDNPVTIRDYKIFRATGPTGSNPESLSYSLIDEVSDGSTSWDSFPTVYYALGGGTQRFYYVTARDDCINESGPSEKVSPTCNFTGDVVILQPLSNQSVPNGAVWLQATVQNGAGPTEIELRAVHLGSGQVMHQALLAAPALSLWDATGDPPGPYRIDAIGQQPTGPGGICTETASIFVTKASP